jgi:hypothetical protein
MISWGDFGNWCPRVSTQHRIRTLKGYKRLKNAYENKKSKTS